MSAYLLSATSESWLDALPGVQLLHHRNRKPFNYKRTLTELPVCFHPCKVYLSPTCPPERKRTVQISPDCKECISEIPLFHPHRKSLLAEDRTF